MVSAGTSFEVNSFDYDVPVAVKASVKPLKISRKFMPFMLLLRENI